MDPAAGTPRGRGRGRGSRPKEQEPAEVDPAVTSGTTSSSPEGSVKSFASTTTVSTSTFGGHGRGRGRGLQGRPLLEPASLSVDPSPVSLPDSPEEDDFLAAFRRLQSKEGNGRSASSRSSGFPFDSCPSPMEPAESGYQSRMSLRTPLSAASPRTPIASRSPTVDIAPEEIGSEDYSELERATVIKRGQTGKLVPVIANYLRLSLAKTMGIYEYHVDFEPPVDAFIVKKKIINGIRNEIGNAKNFDGAKLYLASPLPKKVSEFSEIPHPFNPREIVTVRIKFVKKNSLGECVHFYNVLFRRIMETLGYTEMKRHFYNHKAVFDLPEHKLEIWPGYVTAVDEYEGGLMICCDSSFRVLRTASVLDIWNNFIYEADLDKARKNFLDYILGKIIITRYNNRNYRVDDIDWTQNPTSRFENSKGVKISFLEYYKTAYNIDVRDRNQPLLIHRPKPNEQGVVRLICLIPELCNITGMDSSMTSNHIIMRDVAQHTKLTPAKRNLHLQEFVRNVNGNAETFSMLKMWGLTLEDAAVQLEGRVLTIPQIALNKNCQFHPDTANFGEKVNHNAINDPVPVHNWLLLYAQKDYQRASRMVEVYRQVTRTFGISVSENQSVSVGNGNVRDFREALEKYLRNPNIQLVVMIFPNPREDLYAMAKKMCTVSRPTPTQVILSKTLANDRRIRSVMQKVALQINCKLGGSLWVVRIPLPEKVMFIGMDVYHDPRMKNKSVTAIVASLNTSFTKYYSRVIFQGRHQETVSSILPILMDLMTAFAEENNGYPDRVIVWRDGVSDGQLDFTKKHEVLQVVESFKNLGIEPKFTFCVVQKRINARFFLQGRYEPTNPEPGTVVDHTITRKYLYDFFLVSQLVTQGTVTPTHYVVLEDNSDINPNLIQKFAFATSFMYYNWTGSIRVPAMCQYAHKLASLVGQYVQAEPSLELAKNLYYL